MGSLVPTTLPSRVISVETSKTFHPCTTSGESKSGNTSVGSVPSQEPPEQSFITWIVGTGVRKRDTNPPMVSASVGNFTNSSMTSSDMVGIPTPNSGDLLKLSSARQSAAKSRVHSGKVQRLPERFSPLNYRSSARHSQE